jgi:hypothetical protein
MLKTVTKSGNKKTGPIAVTYRAGAHHAFATCPSSCALNPHGAHGAALIDAEYLAAVRQAVPPGGIAWTYSHFPAALLPVPAEGETVINASTDSPDQALSAVRAGRPAVLAAPAESADQWPQRIDGVRFVRCPAETSEPVNCANCGGKGRPLCARADRDYVIVFTGHGSRARLVGQHKARGCYGELGPVRLQWEAARSKGAVDDASAVRDFAGSLPAGSMLRHHVVGDIGRAA